MKEPKTESSIRELSEPQEIFELLKKELLKEIRFHDLRHAHATLLIKQNVNPKIVSDRLGHSNINTTLNIYAHTLKEMDREAGEKIEDSYMM